MTLKHPFLCIGSLLLALWIWQVNPAQVTEAQLNLLEQAEAPKAISFPYIEDHTRGEHRFVVEAIVHYKPLLNSGILRVTPDDCIDQLIINGKPFTGQSSLPDQPRCYPETLTFDLSHHLLPGRNRIIINAIDKGGALGMDIRALHSTTAIALILLLVGIAWFGWRGASGISPWLKRWHKQIGIAAALLAAGILQKWYYLDFLSGDFQGFLYHWLNHIQRVPLDRAYSHAFSNYAPLYTYLLGGIDLLFPMVLRLHAVKFLSFLGEGIACYFAWRIVALVHGPRSWLALLAPLAIFISPSAAVNSASAAQCDIWYTAFLLATIYTLFIQRPGRAMVYYGIAVSLKLQAVFLAPFLLACLLRHIIRWRHAWIPAAVYIATLLPAWAQGRPFTELLLVYWNQFHTYDNLGNAGNFYFLLREYDFILMRNIGLAVTMVAACIFAGISYKRWRLEKGVIPAILLATFCVGLMPFLLPKMLDRYFFPADMFSLVLACLNPRWILITICFQFSSMLAIPWFNFDEMRWRYDFAQLPWLMAVLNSAALLMLLWLCRKYAWRKEGTP